MATALNNKIIPTLLQNTTSAYTAYTLLFPPVSYCKEFNNSGSVTFLDLPRLDRNNFLKKHSTKPRARRNIADNLMKPLLVLFAFLCSVSAIAQQQQSTNELRKDRMVRQVPSTRTTQKIVIDGDLKDSAWTNAPVASDFYEW